MFRSLLLGLLLLLASSSLGAFEAIPRAWKWLSDRECIFSFDGSYEDSTAFVYNAASGRFRYGAKAPEKFSDFPLHPEGAVNLSYSPDSSALAFTRGNDLYVVDIASGREQRLTFDGSELILNGYASWVYYEEIFGRPSNYKAFWWSPDSRKLAFYRFDNTLVPMFPIYSPFGSQGGTLSQTRYPKAGQCNPEVKVGIIDLESSATTWADFGTMYDPERHCRPDRQSPELARHCGLVPQSPEPARHCRPDRQSPNPEYYYGTPFWSPDSKSFFVQRMPRVQQYLELFAVDPESGAPRRIYDEYYPTWIEWISGMIFTPEGLYMARSFETLWQQIYFLSYDGSCKRLSSGENWDISLIAEDKGEIYFTARRESSVRRGLYKLDRKGAITPLTDAQYYVSQVSLSPSKKYFVARYSNSTTPDKVAVFSLGKKPWQKIVADYAGEDFCATDYALPVLEYMTTADGFTLPAMITYPKNMESGSRYPVHFEVYGGPDTPYVRDYWRTPNGENQWWSDNGIIHIVCDPRSAGHNGRAGEDQAYRHISVVEVGDYRAWAQYMAAKECVDSTRMGVEGFSFGGTTTFMLLSQVPEYFKCGIAGGGVYDFKLYDTHYTERFMDTPENNPEGYRKACCLNYVKIFDSNRVTLRLTHGTGDDNVHLQNTLLLVDALQKAGQHFELMLYPGGMHGYRGEQHSHDFTEACRFWKENL